MYIYDCESIQYVHYTTHNDSTTNLRQYNTHCKRSGNAGVALVQALALYPIPITRFRSFRIQPLENLSATVKLPIKQKGCLGNQTL